MQRYLCSISEKIPGFLPIVFSFLLISVLFLPAVSGQAGDGAALFQPCMACHQIGKGRLIGPDLKGVTQRRDKEWLVKFIQNSQVVVQSGDPIAVKLSEEHNKIPMPPFAYTPEQIGVLLAYIENYDTAQAQVAKPAEEPKAAEETAFFAEKEHYSRDYSTTFIICLILALIACFDLFVTKFIKARFVHLIVILISTFVIIEITVVEAENLGRQQGYEPDQPILFSHKIHAGDNQLNCRFCHFSAEESKHAGIPPMSLCMNCHNVVRQGRNTGTTEIEKIFKSLETGKPVQWVKVHNLPDHTYFNHAQHVKAGKLACDRCHGDVKTMDRIQQVQPLSMGWCVNCHRQTEVQFVDNKFYEKYTRLHEEIKSGKRIRVTADDLGGTECSKCHY